MLMKDLSIIVRQMRVFAERNLSDMNLGFPEQIILMYLAGRECTSQDQIATYFEIDKGAITKTMEKLEEKGMIIRQIDPANKRKKLVTLSPQAEEAIDKMVSAYQDWSQHVCAGISVEEMIQLERTLAIMAENSSILINGEN
ncbi:MAG: MarR family transcriptional regulator [Actinobacteria bacterium]|nr:MarR family transcriptional regulator [Actinomycetota bacterium]